MSSKMFMYFFLQSIEISDGEGQNYSFSAASKGYKQYRRWNKGLSIEMIGHLKN